MGKDFKEQAEGLEWPYLKNLFEDVVSQSYIINHLHSGSCSGPSSPIRGALANIRWSRMHTAKMQQGAQA